MSYRDFEFIVSEYNKASNMPTWVGPSFSSNHIFDEEKSVKWNKEEVIRQNELRKQRAQELRETKNKALQNATAEIISYLKQEYPKISETRIKKLFDLIYSNEYSNEYSIETVVSICEETLEIFSEED